MKQEFSRGRRFAVALLSLLCASILFHAQVADALVIRGDDYLYRGERTQALERYRRALAIAPLFRTAADRYVFMSVQMHTARSLLRGLGVANRYLAARPGDATLLSDRALCYLHLRRYAPAQKDFEDAARASHSPGYYVFAGWAAQHQGRHRNAVALWHAALQLQPQYRPALIALAEHAR